MFVPSTYEIVDPVWKSKINPPREIKNSLLSGLLMHFGSIVAFCLFSAISHFDPWVTSVSFFIVSILKLILILLTEKWFPSVNLDPLHKNDILQGLSLTFLKGVGIGSMVVALTYWVCHFFLSEYSFPIWFSIGLTVAAADFFYYFTHRFLNHSRFGGSIFRWYRKKHAEHHTVKALDFLRGNHSSTFDTAICSFQVPTALVGSFLGLNLTQVLVAYGIVLLLQGTHHVNFTYNIGWLRYVFVDNHNHKLHHCPRGSIVNYGAVFSLWDRLFGTCYENWSLSSNYMEKNRVALPIQRKRIFEIKVPLKEIPPEQKGSVLFGCLGHFGPGFTVLITAVFASQSPLLLLVTFFVASSLAVQLILSVEKKRPCVDLPPPSFKENMKGMAHVFLTAILAGTAVVAGGWWLLHQIPFSSIHLPVFASIVAAVVLADLFYYLHHRFLNHGKMTNFIIRWFRRNHLLHHSVVSLDFMRGSISSFADTAITGFQMPVVLASFIFGMDLIPTLVAYSLLLVLEGTHHVNHTFNIGILRYLFIDNHAHKMHHCLGGHAINQGVIFSVWDRLLGTFYEDRNLSPSYMQKHRIPLPISFIK